MVILVRKKVVTQKHGWTNDSSTNIMVPTVNLTGNLKQSVTDTNGWTNASSANVIAPTVSLTGNLKHFVTVTNMMVGLNTVAQMSLNQLLV